MNKVYEAIRSLPDNPDTDIIWICYNEDMKRGAEDLIKLLKGEHYMDRCKVVARGDEVYTIDHDPIKAVYYYSPDLFDHIGNGAN